MTAREHFQSAEEMFLRRPALRRRWSMSRSGFAALEKSGRLPQPIYIGSSKTPRWSMTSIIEYEQARTLPAASRITPGVALRSWTTGFRRLDGTPLDDDDCDVTKKNSGVRGKGSVVIERCDHQQTPTLDDMGLSKSEYTPAAFGEHAVAQLAAFGVLVQPLAEGYWVIDSAAMTALLALLGASDEE